MLTVNISNEMIRVAQGKRSGKKIIVTDYHTAPLPDGCIINGVITDSEVLSDLIGNLWSQFKLPKKNVNLILNGANVSTKIVNLPRIKPAQLQQVMLDNYSEFDDIETRTGDYRIIGRPKTGEPYTAFSCVAQDDTIKSYIDLFASKKIALSCIDINLNAQIQFINSIEKLKEKTFVLVILDKNTSSLSLYVNGEYRFSNFSRIISERGTPECDDELSSSISSMIQFNKAQKNGYDVEKIYVCGLKDEENPKTLNSFGLSIGVDAEVLPDFAEYVSKSRTKTPLASCFYSVAGLV